MTVALLGFWITCASCVIQIHAVPASHTTAESTTGQPNRKQRFALSLFFGCLIVYGSAAQFRRPVAVGQHSIDRLIHIAEDRHRQWTAQAKQSRSLPEAVAIYKKRYNLLPPPGFDEWYAFAVKHNSSVIDDFDSIWRDLAPFWSLQPSQIRNRTWEAMSSPSNDVTGLAIRGGKTDIYHVRDTHRWMMEGIQTMIRPFEKHIPDMDLAFNTNDEPRVITEYRDHHHQVPSQEHIIKREESSHVGSAHNNGQSAFSPERAKTWQDQYPKSEALGGAFEELSYQNIFHRYGTWACPNRKALASKHIWDRSQLCTTCLEEHSDTVFLKDWRQANNICSQPDLENLHGFYSSPASFKGTHKLLPIFSQSKAPHYNDILYPSPWNYMDKAIYMPSDQYPDMPFVEKKPTLYWRGATTEGVSAGSNVWTGFLRQRFHWLLNSRLAPAALLLLPQLDGNRYTYIPSSELRAKLRPDVKFTDPIVRCGEPDCTNQAYELAPLVSPNDFQAHWGYKYLLDLDGAGFSGRFLPFLQSRSLPFKAALFREWYDDRLEPWMHFVPLDLRGTGLWATLIYFTGWSKTTDSGPLNHANDLRGNAIAESGREWSRTVLRKEDMEIYMFRLLLEWGRMTDDRRDELGFSLDEERR